MYKLVMIFILCISIVESSTLRRKPREIVTNQTDTEWKFKQNCTRAPIDIRLHDISSDHADTPHSEAPKSSQAGFIEILMPEMPGSLFLCFPDNSQEYKQAYTFAHIACRQMGFMTFTDMNRQELPPSTNGVRYYGLRPSSYNCTGQEQSISHCNWDKVAIDTCQMLTELTCGDCQNTIHGSSGLLKSPGFPKAYIFDVTCEWDIIVSLKHTITLTLHDLYGLFPKTSSSCPLNKPYVEITFGTKGRMYIERLCSSKKLESVNIPLHEAKIKLFTGHYGQSELKTQDKQQGVTISFEEIPMEEESINWHLIFLIIFVLIVLGAAAMCHFCYKYKVCDIWKPQDNGLPTINVPTAEEIDRAYEFERCIIQGKENEKHGLRLRSNGSGDKPSRIFFPTTPGTCFEIPKRNPMHTFYQIETPKTIPEVTSECITKGVNQLDPFSHVKTKLVDRYSGSHNNNSLNISSKISVSTPVFYPAAPTFEIYRSATSDKEEEKLEKPIEKPPPYETHL